MDEETLVIKTIGERYIKDIVFSLLEGLVKIRTLPDHNIVFKVGFDYIEVNINFILYWSEMNQERLLCFKANRNKRIQKLCCLYAEMLFDIVKGYLLKNKAYVFIEKGKDELVYWKDIPESVIVKSIQGISKCMGISIPLIEEIKNA